MCDYIFGFYVSKNIAAGNKKMAKRFVMASIIINLLILGFFKYYDFFVINLSLIPGLAFLKPLGLSLPIGISFYTFQTMSYTIDIYKGDAKVQKNITSFGAYVAMFPQLVAGPIVRYGTIAKELNSRKVTSEDFAEGAIRFIYGLAKKIIIANAMGRIADDIFALSGNQLTGKTAWLGAIAYSFQIFYDFSGYSDMAIGLGRIFGFHFLENFNFPYICKTITDFWRRWHISLSTWFRDYVYIPLGGNRVSLGRNLFNILIVWLLTGLWHGAAWNFIVWGLYFAVILVFEKLFLLKFLEKHKKNIVITILSHIYALMLVIVGWVIFRSENLSLALSYMGKMFSPASLFASSSFDRQVQYYIVEYLPEWIFAFLFSVPLGVIVSKIKTKITESNIQKAAEPAFYGIRLVYVFAVFGLSILYLVSSSFNPFIYFRF
jgi:alginate O-acetyltransferase complex protein AlgI